MLYSFPRYEQSDDGEAPGGKSCKMNVGGVKRVMKMCIVSVVILLVMRLTRIR